MSADSEHERFNQWDFILFPPIHRLSDADNNPDKMSRSILAASNARTCGNFSNPFPSHFAPKRGAKRKSAH